MAVGSLLLAGVFCNDYGPDQAAAYVRICNTGAAPADLAGTVLEWDGAPLQFPAGAPLAPGGSVYVAWQAAAFTHLTTRAPDYALDAAGGGIASLSPTQGAPHPLQPAGGSVRLLAPSGAVLDAFVWGNGADVRGWQGPAVAAASGQGAVYQRAIVEASLGTNAAGSFVTDIGSAAAWRQGTDWIPRRSVRAGQSEWDYPAFTVDGARLFACPEMTTVMDLPVSRELFRRMNAFCENC